MAAANLSLNANISTPLRFASASKTTGRGTFAIRWSLPPPPPPPAGPCFAESFAKPVVQRLQCPNHLLNPIQGFEIASYGNGTGNCSAGLAAGGCSADLRRNLTALCKGHTSCQLLCDPSAATCTV